MSSEALQSQAKLFNPFAWAKRHLDAGAFPSFLKQARKRGDQARATLRTKTISYGPTFEQRLEWFLVEGSEKVFVYIHGGGWRAADVMSSAFMAETMASRGIETVVLGYDLCPNVTLRTLVKQISEGFQVLLANLRPGAEVYVAGISSGAHLTATLLAAFPREPRIKGFILQAGLYDLRPLSRNAFNDVLQMSASDAEALSPLLTPDLSGPAKVFVTIGTLDSPAFIEQADKFGDALRQSGREVVERREEGLDHLHMSEAWLEEDSQMVNAILSFIGV